MTADILRSHTSVCNSFLLHIVLEIADRRLFFIHSLWVQNTHTWTFFLMSYFSPVSIIIYKIAVMLDTRSANISCNMDIKIIRKPLFSLAHDRLAHLPLSRTSRLGFIVPPLCFPAHKAFPWRPSCAAPTRPVLFSLPSLHLFQELLHLPSAPSARPPSFCSLGFTKLGLGTSPPEIMPWRKSVERSSVLRGRGL